jgi:hypothetical protein
MNTPLLLKQTDKATKQQLTRVKNVIKTKPSILNNIQRLNLNIERFNTTIANLKNSLLKTKQKQILKVSINMNTELLKNEKKQLKFYTNKLNLIQKAEQNLNNYNEYIKQKNALVRQSVVRISENENNNYTYKTHGIQLYMMRDRQPNMLYRQIVEYFDSNDNKSRDGAFQSHIYEMRTVASDNIHTIVLAETHGGSDGDWKANLWSDMTMGAYTIITTQAIRPLEFDNNNLQLAEQVFQLKEDNKKTCVIDACIKFFEARSENPKAKTMLNRLKKNYSLYENGIPESEMAKFGELIQSSLNIIDFVNGTTKSFNKSSYNRFAIEFINTRFNHIELLCHNYDEPTLICKEEYKLIKENEQFYIDKFGTLTTQDKTYKLKSTDFKDTYKNWYDENQLDKKFIYSDSDEYNLINGYEYNMHNFFKKSYDDYLGPCSSMEHVIERMVDHFFVVLEYVAD